LDDFHTWVNLVKKDNVATYIKSLF
jgi:hypothetical protein